MQGSLDLAADLALQLVIAREEAWDASVTRSLRQLTELADVDRCYVTLFHDDGTFENSHEWTAAHVVPHRPAIQRMSTDQFRYSVDLAFRNEVLAAPDIAELPERARPEYESFSSFGVRSVLQVPIRVDDRTVGLIGFNSTRPVVSWPDELIETARRVGQAIGVALVRQRAAHDVRAARDEAERANRAKDDLLASVSHELRTPLHAMLGYAELLGLGDRSEDERLAVLEIERNGRRLLNLVEDLLDLARQGSGPVEPVTVSGVLDEVIHILEPAARLRGISFDTTALTGLELAVEASRLRQVLHCVVANGLQALSAGGRIRIEPASTAGSRGVAMSLTGPNRIETDGLVTPLVLTLLADVGSIRVVTDDDDTAAGVVVEFAQDASP